MSVIYFFLLVLCESKEALFPSTSRTRMQKLGSGFDGVLSFERDFFPSLLTFILHESWRSARM
jgi:hypothetical protein